MNAKDCKPATTDVIGPRVPAVVIAVAALIFSVIALVKVFELESELNSSANPKE